MKFRATILVTLLTVLFAVSSGEAMKLDAPHNKDNGIGCYDCHSEDPRTPSEDYWWKAYAGSDPDFSVYNWVCQRCHSGADSTFDPSKPWHEGPFKVTHSKSTTDPNNPTDWTTECVDCHDPHFQEQVRWAGDPGFFYIAEGTFDTVFSPVAPTAPDTYHPTGTTSFGVNSFTFVADFDPAACDWSQKCKSTTTFPNYNARAKDLSRGFIMVADKLNASTSPTYEIIDAQPQGGGKYILTVKGDIRFVADPGGIQFGVIYGGLLNKHVVTPAVTGDGRPVMSSVKFFTPKKVAGGAGGPVDLTAGATEPVGMCQVCHTATSWFNETDPTSTNHYDSDGRACYDCHAIEDGGEPVIDHASFITDTNNCNGCHSGYASEPDTKHIGLDVYLDCQACHTDPAVDPNGAPYLRTTAGVGTPAVEQRVPYTSNGTIHAAVDCTVCHNATYGSGDYTLGHPAADVGAAHDTAMTALASCVSACHGSLTGVSPGSEIVTNSENPGGHSDKCVLCHVTVTPSPVELTSGARPDLQPHAGTTCGGCHQDYFGGHAHDHTGQISNHVDCDGCHDATPGSAADAITAPYVGDTEVHYNAGNPCQTCHNAADGMPVGSAATGWGATWSSTLTGDCTTCHGAYFTSHPHHGSAENDVTYNGVNDKTLSGTSCVTCHQDAGAGTASLDTWTGIIKEHDTNGPKDGDVTTCAKCHSYDQTNGVYNTMDPVTVANAISSGNPATCATCHTAKAGPSAVDHGGHLASHFLWGGDCDDCHSATPGNPQEEVVLEIHSDNCALCHYDPDGVKDGDATNNFDRIVGDPTFGVDGDATEVDGVTWTKSNSTCETCHITATPLISKPSIHHDTANAVATPTSSCTTACHNTTTGHAGDHFTVPLVGNVAPCQTCHTATAPTNGDNVPVNPTADPAGDKVHDYCTTCHVVGAGNIIELVVPSGSVTTMDNPIGTATNNGGGPCSDCHTTYFNDHNHPHALTSVVNPCEGCHGATAAPFVATGGAHETNGCATCHDLDASPTGLIIVGSSAEGATGTENCQGCHTGYFDNHTHSHTGISIAPNCGTADCHDADGGVNAPSAGSAPYLGAGEVHDSTTGLMMTCGSCHDLAGNGGPKAGTSAANWGGGVSWAAGSPGNCESCHNAGDFNTTHAGLLTAKLNTLHSTGNAGAPVVSENAGCMVCHDGVGSSAAKTASNITRPYLATGTPGQVHAANGCATCHQTSGAMISPAPALAPLLSATGGDCTGCHGAYFDSHTHHANPATNDFTLDPLVDLSYAAPGQTCGNASGTSCHHDYDDDSFTSPKYPEMTDWITIQWEHDRTDGLKDGSGACITCHNGDQPIRASNIDPAYITPDDNIRGVVKTGTAVHCLTCHSDKVTPAVHGLDHIDHLLVNNTAQSTLGWPPIIPDAECVTCHVVVADYGDDAEEIAANALGDVIIDMHSRNCGACHRSQPELKLTPYDLSIFEQTDSVVGLPSPDGALCTECHQSSITISKTFHDMLSTEAQVIARHDLLGDSGSALNGPADCMACHAEMVDVSNVTKKLDRHQTCEKCHTASGLAVTVIANGSESATTPINQTCENCHNIKDDLIGGPGYRLHGLTGDAGVVDGVATEHNNLAASGANDCSASGCHTMTNATEKLALHVQGCLTCHAPAALAIVNPDPDGPVDALAQVDNGLPLSNDGYPAGNNLPVNCDDCHVQVGSFNMHGLDNPTAAPVHDKLAGSSTLSPGSAEDCETCHPGSGATAFEKRLSLHASCAMCHGEATAPATTAISNGIAGTTINCETCHGDANPNTYYTMHAMTEDAVATAGIHENISTVNSGFAGNDHCANCHAMGTQADMLRIHMSAPVKQNPVHTGDCLTCHTAPDDIDGGSAATTISEGTSAVAGGGGLGKTCASCHVNAAPTPSYKLHGLTDANVAAAHDQMTAQTLSSNSNCVGCHTPDTPLGRLQIHPLNPNTCLACHNATDPAVVTSISEGFNNTNSAPCDDCHGPGAGPVLLDITGDAVTTDSWYNHLDPGHVGFVDGPSLPTTNAENCTSASCHAGDTIAMHDSVAPAASPNVCAECHDTDSSMWSPAPANAPSHNAPGGECLSCHGAYFDSHDLRGIDSSGHEAYYKKVAGEDITLSGKYCGECHKDKTNNTPTEDMTYWNGILWEHDLAGGKDGVGACAFCHDYDGLAGPLDGDVTAAIATTGNSCGTCHDDKSMGPLNNGASFHGGHDGTHWDWTVNSAETCGASACHNYQGAGNPEVVSSVHNGAWAQTEYSGNICTNCHNQAPIGSGVDNNTGAGSHNRGTAEITTNGGPANPDPAFHNEECIACHSGANAFDNHLHDHSVELATDSVDSSADNTLRTQDCDRCHGGTDPAAAFTAADHNACASCHALPVTDVGKDGTRISVAADSSNFTPGGPADDCDACHSGGVGYFDSHTSRGATGTHDITYVPANDLSQDGTQPCADAGCHLADPDGINGPLSSWEDVLAEHNNSCVICHDYDDSAGGTPPVADNYTAISGTGIECGTCHTPKIYPNAGASHGGHAATDFAWSASCGTADCHDSANNDDIVAEVHGQSDALSTLPDGRVYTQFNNSCQNCHSDSGGGSGNTIGGILTDGYVGDARLQPTGPAAAGGAPHLETCEDCHGTDIPRIHHERNMSASAPGRAIPSPTVPSNVQNGWCYLCHTDNNYAGVHAAEPGGDARTVVMHGATNPTEQRPGITPCAFCHVDNTGGTFKIKKYDLNRIDPISGGPGLASDSIDPADGTFTHYIPNNGSAIDIVNYGVCFHCHGDTSDRPVNYPYTGLRADGRAVKPRHAFRLDLLRGDETNVNETPRIRLGLHPGHIQYRLMGTAPNDLAYTKVGADQAAMMTRVGTNNRQLYKSLATQSLGQSKDYLMNNYPIYYGQWACGKLSDCYGVDLFIPVQTQQVPYTINGDTGGPYIVPQNP